MSNYNLYHYCRRNFTEKAIDILEKSKDIDILYEEGIFFRFAISKGNVEICKSLLEYFENKQFPLKNKDYEEVKEKVMGTLKDHFRPEFLNRLDDIIIFDVLSKEALAKIVEKQVNEIVGRLAAKRISLVITPEVRTWLSEQVGLANSTSIPRSTPLIFSYYRREDKELGMIA
jgi:hypothetical protein